MLLFLVIIALLLMLALWYSGILANRCGPWGACPSGWDQGGTVLTEIHISAATDSPPLIIKLRTLRWGERFAAAKLIAKAHKYSATYTHLFEMTAPPNRADIRYAYTAEQRAQVADQAVQVRDPSSSIRQRGLVWIFERNLAMLSSNRNLIVR